MTTFYDRWQHLSVLEALHTRRVVIISGPRQCGKTTLARSIVLDKKEYRSLDDGTLLQAASFDPLSFARHGQGTLVIDEVQKAPQLIPAIKIIVDEDNTPGQFLLTGSSDIYRHPEISESLAGRLAHIRLRPLSIGEVLGSKATFLERSFQRAWTNRIGGFDQRAILELAFRGGYPETLSLSGTGRKRWHKDYLDSLLMRDLADISNIRRKDVMRRLLSVLMSWSGKFMEASSICAGLSITRPTLSSYVNALEALYLFEKLEPWIKTDYERVARREKTYATDTGLMASCLDWHFDTVQFDSDRLGKMVETLVFCELSAQIDLDYQYSLSHYRDRNDREIDFLVDDSKGRILGIEVKASSAVSHNDAKHLIWFKDNIAPQRAFTGMILYAGEHTLSMGNDIYAVPIAALWEGGQTL